MDAPHLLFVPHSLKSQCLASAAATLRRSSVVMCPNAPFRSASCPDLLLKCRCPLPLLCAARMAFARPLHASFARPSFVTALAFQSVTVRPCGLQLALLILHLALLCQLRLIHLPLPLSSQLLPSPPSTHQSALSVPFPLAATTAFNSSSSRRLAPPASCFRMLLLSSYSRSQASISIVSWGCLPVTLAFF